MSKRLLWMPLPAKRCWDHHMLVCWWHTLLAPVPCLHLPLSSSLFFTSCTTVCLSTDLLPTIWIQSRYHFALASMSACACAQFMHINVCHILTKLKFLKHYRHMHICMWSQHRTITCLVLRGSVNNAPCGQAHIIWHIHLVVGHKCRAPIKVMIMGQDACNHPCKYIL